MTDQDRSLDPAESWLFAHIEATGRKMAVLKEMIVAMKPLRDDDRRWCIEQLHSLVTNTGADSIVMPGVTPRAALPPTPTPTEEERPSIEEGMKDL